MGGRNQTVINAAFVMEAKAKYNELVAEQMVEKGDLECAERLRKMNARIAEAVDLMREYDGCWA